MSVPLHLRLSLPHLQPRQPLRSRCRSTNTATIDSDEEYHTMASHNPLTGYEPKLLDNFDYSETFATIFQDESGDIDTEP